MKRIGILFGLLLLSACMVWAQDNTDANSSSMNNGNNTAQTNQAQQNSTTTTTTTTTTRHNHAATTDNQSDPADQSEDAQDAARKNAATADDNAAAMEKEKAKNASGATAEREKAIARLDSAAADLNQLLAAPDNGIPDSVFTKAKCVAIIPDMIKGGFIFGAEHGRGVASCRTGNDDHWSAPVFFEMTGGNWGAQIGVEGVDLTMLIMNQNGMNQLLSSKWKLGGNASASAGPVGRTAAADTNLKFNSEILTYSRSRGLYAGATLNGANIKADQDAMTAYYGRDIGFVPVLTGKVSDPHGHNNFTAALRRNVNEVNAQAH